MALESVVGEEPPHVGMAGEQDAVEVVGLAFEPVGAGKNVDDRGYRRRLVGFELYPDAPVLLRRKQVIDDIEASLTARPVDRRHIDDAQELAALVIAQERHDLQKVAWGRDDRQFAMSDPLIGHRSAESAYDHLCEFSEIIHRSGAASAFDRPDAADL